MSYQGPCRRINCGRSLGDDPVLCDPCARSLRQIALRVRKDLTDIFGRAYDAELLPPLGPVGQTDPCPYLDILRLDLPDISIRQVVLNVWRLVASEEVPRHLAVPWAVDLIMDRFGGDNMHQRTRREGAIDEERRDRGLQARLLLGRFSGEKPRPVKVQLLLGSMKKARAAWHTAGDIFDMDGLGFLAAMWGFAWDLRRWEQTGAGWPWPPWPPLLPVAREGKPWRCAQLLIAAASADPKIATVAAVAGKTTGRLYADTLEAALELADLGLLLPLQRGRWARLDLTESLPRWG